MSLQHGGFDAQRPMTTPAFTAREITQVENFAAQQSDSGVRAQFETMIRSAITNGQVSDFTSSAAEQWDRSQMRGIGPKESQLSKDDYLNMAKDMINKVSANSSSGLPTLNEAAVAAESNTASDILAALL